ncbi:hypothetical protein [Litoribacter ruber]|uniref:hypothetical protein n=1 Tax=Litoribacter ruber TaxID=702568 RepID=UPI001FE69CF7|nr:hypothetical protein [Litoribacter ruber]
MIHSVRFTCVLDTNVIYPIEIRDILFWFAHFDLYTPKWSENRFLPSSSLNNSDKETLN